jgi:thioredoxin-related protein
MMRKKMLFVVILCLAMTTISAQDKIQWMTMNEALASQKENPKKIIMDVYTKWCGPCKLMDKNTFSNKDVIDFINENFYAVKFNAEGTEEVTYQDFTYTNPNYQPGRKGRNATHFFADALRISGYPSMVFFKDDGELIQSVPGYRTPKQLEIYLKMIANDDYQNLTTVEAWEEYQKNFKGTFK